MPATGISLSIIFDEGVYDLSLLIWIFYGSCQLLSLFLAGIFGTAFGDAFSISIFLLLFSPALFPLFGFFSFLILFYFCFFDLLLSFFSRLISFHDYFSFFTFIYPVL